MAVVGTEMSSPWAIIKGEHTANYKIAHDALHKTNTHVIVSLKLMMLPYLASLSCFFQTEAFCIHFLISAVNEKAQVFPGRKFFR